MLTLHKQRPSLDADFSKLVEAFLVEFSGQQHRAEGPRAVVVETPRLLARLFWQDGTIKLEGYSKVRVRNVVRGCWSALSGWRFAETSGFTVPIRKITRK